MYSCPRILRPPIQPAKKYCIELKEVVLKWRDIYIEYMYLLMPTPIIDGVLKWGVVVLKLQGTTSVLFS